METTNWIPIIWVAAGIIMILLEFVVPGLVIAFFGIGAIATGLCILAGLPSEGATPFWIFSAVTILSLLFLRKRFKKVFTGDSLDPSSELDDEFVGHIATVLSWDEKRSGGKVSFRGTSWEAHSAQSFQIGDITKITGRHGALLEVVAASNP